ncbi:MAG TPA: serine hydrolase domain-containing protein [Candidatus Angelobacter sp.]|jgi:CubicO group peptidase (beta-lactamase class C family)
MPGNHAILRNTVFCAILIFGLASATAQANRTKPVFDQVDAYLTKEAQAHFFRGVVLVGIDGRIEFEKGYGNANDEWEVRNTPATKFRIASLTKQFTAACILLLQERGRLNVRDPISKYLSGLPDMWRTITIHQLLTHTSGIPNYTNEAAFARIRRTGATPAEMVALAAAKPLEFTPGTKWAYSNTGYILLGMLIEKASGQTYADFLQSNIFGPLGMTNSGYDRTADILKERASGYELKDGHLVNADFIDMSVPYAAGGIYSTVEDMYRWNEALAHEGKLLSAGSLKQMFTLYPEAAYQGQHYGYGVVISELKFGKLLYYHGGGVDGFSSSIQRYPKERVCIVVLTNLGSLKPWELGDHIAAEVFKEPGPIAAEPAVLPFIKR